MVPNHRHSKSNRVSAIIFANLYRKKISRRKDCPKLQLGDYILNWFILIRGMKPVAGNLDKVDDDDDE